MVNIINKMTNAVRIVKFMQDYLQDRFLSGVPADHPGAVTAGVGLGNPRLSTNVNAYELLFDVTPA
jgi:hypothetical protein